jgi:HlyD family secretion protein
MAKRKSRKRIVIWIIIGVVVIAGVLGYLNMRQNLAAANRTIYDIVAVTRGDIEVTVKGSGSVQPIEDATVYADSAATVDTVHFENGDTVSAGDIVAVLSSDTLESQKDTLKQQIDDADAAIASMRSVSGGEYIYSPVDGTIKAVYAAAGDSADVVTDRDGALAVICPDELLKVTVPGDSESWPGQKVTVTVGSKSVTGEVTAVYESSITVRFKDSGFALGEAAIVTEQDGAQLGEGSVEIANPIYIKGRGGTIRKIYADSEKEVSRGDKLFRLKGEVLSDALYTQIKERQNLQDDLDDVLADMEALTVRAGLSGVISGLSLNPGQTVQGGAALFTVQSDGEYKIDVDIDELDIAGIELGEAAEVTFDALPGERFTATVAKINPIGTAVGNVTNFKVTLSLSDAPGVMLGMSADVEIVSESAQGVLLIPIEAIQVIGTQKYVALETDIDPKADTVTATRPVVTGITDGVSIEIREGLSEGDRIAVPRVSAGSGMQMWSMGSSAGSQAGSQQSGTVSGQ